MADSGGNDIVAGCCGVCCIACTESISTWTLFQACGADGAGCCSGPAGCCNKCFGDSFNNDSLEDELERERAARAANGDANATQPAPNEGMTKDIPAGNSNSADAS